MHYRQALEQPDREKFLQRIRKEGEAHYSEDHCRLVKRSEVLKGATILPSVWQMKEKKTIHLGKIVSA